MRISKAAVSFKFLREGAGPSPLAKAVLGLYLLLVVVRGGSHLLCLAESEDTNLAEVVGFSPSAEFETLVEPV